MHIDLHAQGGAPARLDADVAIIGAGAAGLTVCRRLLKLGYKVALLESGGTDFESATAELNIGANVGQPYYDLDHARLRFFGGTTAVWGGRCAELDPIDFEQRPWVPHSGWPLTYGELRSYYSEAWHSLGLGETPMAVDDALPPFRSNELGVRSWRFDEQADRFSFAECRDLILHPDCMVVTHATVREIVAAGAGQAVASLDVQGLNGKRIAVHAANYVLAAGGLENPRLLLASRSVVPAGLGNENDQVGRFFMEHPHARGGRIIHGRVWRLLSAFRSRRLGGTRIAPLLTPSADLQRREGLLNGAVTIAARRGAQASEALLMRAYHHVRHHADPTRAGRTAWRTLKHLVRGLQRFTDPLRPWALSKLGMADVALVVRAEQAPNPDSRVLLSDDLDALGMPRIKLDWRTTELDVRSVAGLVAAVDRECQRLGLGNVETASWLADGSAEWVTDPLISTHPIGGYHHIGTTRMSSCSRRGVTDSVGRVHTLENLYIAGSSLFPTGGWANPTLTIIALALRTADAIANKMDNRGRSYSVGGLSYA